MRLPRICRRCASAFARNCDSSQRLSPSWRGLGRELHEATAALGRAGWVRGRRRESVPGGLAAASMRRTLPRTQPARPLTVSCGGPPRKKEKKSRSGSRAALARKQTNKKDAANAASFLFSISSSVAHALAHRHRETVGGGAVWVGRTVGAMDGAIEPPWVRALCLRSTASQAPERTAASGWAGPRRGVHGVSCQPTPPRPTHRNPEPLWLWLWLLPAAGGPPRVSAAPPHPTRSGSSRRYRQCRSSRSGSWPGTAGDSPRRSSTSVPDTRSRW